MDYSLILNEISNNQVDIINLLNRIDEGIFVLVFTTSIIFLYLFIRNLSKS